MKKRFSISILVIIVFSIFLVGFIKVNDVKTNLTIDTSWGLGLTGGLLILFFIYILPKKLAPGS